MISIIIPSYNRFSLLKEAVKSCLNQTFQDIEIIIVDDGSTDGTEERVRELLRKEWNNEHISYFKQKNAGASAARNFGLENAKGEFIQFLDSDDLLYPGKLQVQLEEINKQNVDVCSCYGFMGTVFGAVNNEILGSSFENKIDLMHKMCSGTVHAMCTPAPLWRKTVLDGTNGWNTSIDFGDDLEYHIRLLCKVTKVSMVPEKLFFVRQHADFRLSDARGNVKQIESGIATQYSIYDVLSNNGLWDTVFQQGVLTNLKTLYANYMKLANSKEVYKFESSLMKISKDPITNNNMLLLVAVRRLVGSRFILTLFNLKKRMIS